MKKITTISIILLLFALYSNAQFNSITNCGALGVGHSIFFINPDTGFVAGEDIGKGVIQRTFDGGNTWTRVYTSATNLEWVLDIHFVNSTTGFATGVNGSILKTTDCGLTWSHQIISGIYEFRSVYFTSPSVGFVVGDGVVEGPIYKTTDGGINWFSVAPGANSFFNDVFFIDVNTGFVVGDYDMYKTTDGGNSWNSITINTAEHFQTFCLDLNTCYLTGSDGIKKTTDGGLNWSANLLPSLPAPNIYFIVSIYFTDVDTGFGVGAKVDTTNFTPTGFALLKTIDGGQNWFSLNNPSNAMLNSIHFVDSQIGYIVGSNGNTLKTTNAGGNDPSYITKLQSKNTISIFPNPSSGTFVIETNGTQKQTVQVFDITGKLMLTQTIQNGKTIINASRLAQGVYNVSVTSSEGVVNKRVVVK